MNAGLTAVEIKTPIPYIRELIGYIRPKIRLEPSPERSAAVLTAKTEAKSHFSGADSG